MKFLKQDGHISIERRGIPKDRKPEYSAVLYCELELAEKNRQFVHLCVSRNQLETLRDLIDEHLENEDPSRISNC